MKEIKEKETNNEQDERILKLLKKAEDANNTVTFTSADGIDVSVKKVLSYEDFQSFIISMMNWCADFESNPYCTDMYDIALRYHTITYFTDIELVDLSVEQYWNILYHTSLFREVVSRINSEDYKVLLKTVKEQFEFEKQKEVAVNTLRANQLINSVTELTGNIDPDKISEMLETLNKSGITTEEIIGNVVSKLKTDRQTSAEPAGE